MKIGHPKLPMKHAERLLDRYIERWIYLFGLGKWRITWGVVEILKDKSGEYTSECVPNFKNKTANLRFNRRRLISQAFIEKTVVHELLHLFDKGKDYHLLIYRLEVLLRRVRQRASRRA